MDFNHVSGFDADDFSSQTLQDYDAYAITSFEKEPIFGRVITMDLWVVFHRFWSPFVLKYHVPSAGIVLLCHISYVIPPNTAIPGRVALLATNFLALSNLFGTHQVH